MAKRLLIGLGSGRCGTKSLSELLNQQPNTCVTHEFYTHLFPHPTWARDRWLINRRLSRFLLHDAEVVGDVAFFYLPYVARILSRWPGARFICMQREREATLDSMLKRAGPENIWQEHDGSQWIHLPGMDRLFPKYEAPTRREAAGMFYDEYYQQARVCAKHHPSAFRVFDVESLNDDAGVREILDCAGFPRDEQHVVVGLRLNRAGTGRWEKGPQPLLGNVDTSTLVAIPRQKKGQANAQDRRGDTNDHVFL